jgi:hypothetical protein
MAPIRCLYSPAHTQRKHATMVSAVTHIAPQRSASRITASGLTVKHVHRVRSGLLVHVETLYGYSPRWFLQSWYFATSRICAAARSKRHLTDHQLQSDNAHIQLELIYHNCMTKLQKLQHMLQLSNAVQFCHDPNMMMNCGTISYQNLRLYGCSMTWNER